MFFFLKPIKWAIKLFSLAVLAAIVYSVICAVGVVRAESAVAAASGAKAIVVTGSSAPGGAPSADLLARLNAALTLYRAHAATQLVVTGPGASSTSSSIAQVAGSWLENQAVPATAVTEITTSNASEFANVAGSLGSGSSVIVVTDAVDARWALDAAGAAGLHASVSIVPGTKKLFVTDLGSLLREATGVAAGRVIGYDHAAWAAS